MEDDSRSVDLFDGSGDDMSTTSFVQNEVQKKHSAKHVVGYVLRTSGSSGSEEDEEDYNEMQKKGKRTPSWHKKEITTVKSSMPSRKDISTLPASKKTRIVEQYLLTMAKDTSV